MDKDSKVLVLDPLHEFSAYLSQLLPKLGDYQLEICETTLSLVAKATVAGSGLVICGVENMKQNSRMFEELHQKFPKIAFLLVGDYKPSGLPPAIRFIRRPARQAELGECVRQMLESSEDTSERLEYSWLLSIND